MMNTLKEVIDIVSKSPASIFTRQDVLELLLSTYDPVDKGSDGPANPLSDDLLDAIRSATDSVDSEFLIDRESAEYYMDGNEVMLQDVEVDRDYLYDSIVDALSLEFGTPPTKPETPADLTRKKKKSKK